MKSRLESLLQSPPAALRQGIARPVVDHEVDVDVKVAKREQVLTQSLLSAVAEPPIEEKEGGKEESRRGPRGYAPRPAGDAPRPAGNTPRAAGRESRPVGLKWRETRQVRCRLFGLCLCGCLLEHGRLVPHMGRVGDEGVAPP
jgi:hypothetical protein